MIRHGSAPFLECSSRGERRLSAFYARLASHGNRSIEEIYQSSKVFIIDGGHSWQPQDWRRAKGLRAANHEEVTELYSTLWDIYIMNNRDLLYMIIDASGLSDMFGKEGNCCQATELWRIRCQAIWPEGDPKAQQLIEAANRIYGKSR